MFYLFHHVFHFHIMFCEILNTSCLLLNYVMILYIFLMFESCSFKPPNCFVFCQHIFYVHIVLEFLNTSSLLVNYVLNIHRVFHLKIVFDFRNIIFFKTLNTQDFH